MLSENCYNYLLQKPFSESVAKLCIKDLVRKDAGKYEITVTNSAGSKTASLNIIVMEKPSVPVGPLEVTDINAESAVLSWDVPEEDGGNPVTHYVVDKLDPNMGWQEVSGFVVRTTHKVTRLTTSQEYAFRVRAVNRFGISDALDSSRIIAKHPFKKPLAPGAPRCMVVTRESVSLMWQDPTNDGGSPVLG